MKNITKIIIALFAIVAFSCTQDDVENRPVITPGDAPVLTAPSAGALYVFTPENATATAERFTWDSANFGGDVEVTYAVQMDVKGGDFSAPQTLGSVVSANQVAVTVEVMNAAAIALEGDNAVSGVPADFDIRVIATTGVSTSIVSTITSINITPYIDAIPYPFTDWYLVGDATAAGWDNNKGNQPLFRDGANANIYKFTGYFVAGAFKLISTPGQWAPMLGGADGTLISRPTESDPDPASIQITTAGYYTFTIDTAALTYTLEPYTGATTLYTTVGIIGSATANSWDSSTPLTQSGFNEHVWKLTGLDLKNGEVKFRANDAWDVNWGGKTAFSSIAPTGDNIPVTGSKYNVYFNDLDGSYLMVPNQE